MNRFITSVILILISVGIGIFSLTETTKLCNTMTQKIEILIVESEALTEKERNIKKDELYSEMVELNNVWENASGFFYFFFNNDDIKTIETNIKKLPIHAKNGEVEALYLCLVECSEEFQYIKNSSHLNFNNIF